MAAEAAAEAAADAAAEAPWQVERERQKLATVRSR
jgi:hypothetical protein